MTNGEIVVTIIVTIVLLWFMVPFTVEAFDYHDPTPRKIMMTIWAIILFGYMTFFAHKFPEPFKKKSVSPSAHASEEPS